jgi:hypothetical protein
MRDNSPREQALQKLREGLQESADKSSPAEKARIEDSIERLERISRGESAPAPSAITLELLKATPDTNLNPLICDYVHACLFDDSNDSDAALAELPQGMRYAWHISGIEFEIPNGGFNQFFFNTSGQYALDTLEALRAIGANEQAEILEKAIALFEKKYSRPAASRKRWYGKWRDDPEIEAMERRFDDLIDTGASSFVPYVRKHPEEFLHQRRLPAK